MDDLETGQTLSLVRWDGRDPTSLIAQVEARLAAGVAFAVLAPVAPMGREDDAALLEGWWRAVSVRLGDRCAGWAHLAPGAAVDHADEPDVAGFPVRACADQADAIDWLRAKLAECAVRYPAPGSTRRDSRAWT